MRLRRHHKKQKQRPQKHRQEFVPRKLNRTHLAIYFAVAIPLLMLSLGLVLDGLTGSLRFLLTGLLIFLFGICRFPIIRGTGKKAGGGALADFLGLAIPYFVGAVIIGLAVAAGQYFGGRGTGPLPGLIPNMFR